MFVMEEEKDIVVFTDENGKDIELEVIDYFTHNDQEYAVLVDVEEEEEEDESCGETSSCEKSGCCCGHDDEQEEEQDLYIMKVVVDGEMEEFIPVEESELDELTEIVQKRFSEEDDDDDEEDE